MNEEICIREMEDGDKNFILYSFVQSYVTVSAHAKVLEPSDARQRVYRIARQLISWKGNRIVVATPKDERDVILGFVIAEAERRMVHYTYVKKAFRRFGIAKVLLASLKLEPPFEITHWTRDMEKITKKFPGIQFNPVMLTELFAPLRPTREETL